MRKLKDVRYIQELRNNMISLGILHKNGFSYSFDRDRDIMKVIKDMLILMRERRTTSNIYK